MASKPEEKEPPCENEGRCCWYHLVSQLNDHLDMQVNVLLDLMQQFADKPLLEKGSEFEHPEKWENPNDVRLNVYRLFNELVGFAKKCAPLLVDSFSLPDQEEKKVWVRIFRCGIDYAKGNHLLSFGFPHLNDWFFVEIRKNTPELLTLYSNGIAAEDGGPSDKEKVLIGTFAAGKDHVLCHPIFYRIDPDPPKITKNLLRKLMETREKNSVIQSYPL